MPPSRYWVRLGEHSLSWLDFTEQIRRSGLSVTHPGYQGALKSHDHDLRLLRLGTPVLQTRSVRPLPLPTSCAAAGTECHISGWGTTTQPWSKGGSGGVRMGKSLGCQVSGQESCHLRGRLGRRRSHIRIMLWGLGSGGLWGSWESKRLGGWV